MTHRIAKALIAASAFAWLAACGPASEQKTDAAQTAAVDYAGAAAAALANPVRLAGDRDNDARRKAQESLTFFQVAPGDTVFELEAGGGFWTEVLSLMVGPQGHVITQNPEEFRSFITEELGKRFTEGRLGNVRQTWTRFEALDAPDASADVVTWVLGPHELFYTPEGASAMLGDPAKVYAEIFRITKPGGVFIVIDHSAADGSPASTGGTIHRIDPAHVIAAAQAAGFTLEERGEFLRNPEDTRTTAVFDPSIRGHTDQFALRFRKAR